MPMYPMLNESSSSIINTTTFYGLNRGLSISEGEMQDMTNMSADHYPVLSTRKGRSEKTWQNDEQDGVSAFPGEVDGMIGNGCLVVCQGGKVYVDGVQHALTVSDEEHMKPKRMVAMGAYVCIWPDKKYLNTANTEDYGNMGMRWEAGGQVSATMCRMDGTNYDTEEITVAETAPEEPTDQQLWLDTSGETHVLKQYSAAYLEWIQIATTYIKLQASGIGKSIRVGDVVFISGAKIREQEQVSSVQGKLSFTAESFYLYSSFQTVQYGGTDYRSTTAETVTQTRTIQVTGIPEGAKVLSAVLHVTTGSSKYGAKVLTINGKKLAEKQENTVSMDLSGNGDVSLKFVFQSYNSADTAGRHGGTVSFSDIRLDIDYETKSSGTGAETDRDEEQVEALNTSNIVYASGEDYIVVAGLLHRQLALKDGLTVEIKIPDLDYVCETNNRLWGCAYDRKDGELTNEIRACALGDFRNWYKFQGISTDSYTVSVGSEGKFTAAFSYSGKPLFFKEACMHRISGTMPSNFTLNTTRCRGVQEGSARSLAIVNERLFYKAREDVMVYDGATPYAISEKLGKDRYCEAAAGAYRDKYYISMQDENVCWHLFVYDTAKGMWHREDETHALCMENTGGELVMAVAEQDGSRLMVVESGEESLEWSATFGTFGFAYEEQKYLSRFNIRAQMEKGSIMRMEIMYDSNGEWVKAGETRCPALRTLLLPIIPRRCDHCQVRLSGKGMVRIYSIARVLVKGRDG
ncbi:MAG: hypothetical protein ACI4WX_10115 [Aristaeellaceae bacterium]